LNKRDLFSVLIQVLDRGEKIELLVDKTENLHQQVSDSLSLSLSHARTHIYDISREQ
jgi:hypothetical protein